MIHLHPQSNFFRTDLHTYEPQGQSSPRGHRRQMLRPGAFCRGSRPLVESGAARRHPKRPVGFICPDADPKPSTPKVRLAFHTSVLIAAVVETHLLHRRMRPWLAAAASDEVEARISWRAASDTWHAFRRQPGRSLAQAEAVIDDLLRHFQPVETTTTIYRGALRRCNERGLGGSLTDAIHLLAAEETGADGFITLHAESVQKLCTADSPKILPPDPPA